MRVVIGQIVAKSENESKAYKVWTALVDKMLKPHIATEGYDWGYHIDGRPRRRNQGYTIGLFGLLQ